jgi:hypothetical protein
VAYAEHIPRVGIAEEFIHLGIGPTLPQGVTWLYPAKGEIKKGA